MSEYIINDEQIAENRRLHGKKLLVMPVIVRCRDCARFIPQGTKRFEDGTVNKDTCDVVRGFIVQIDPDGFCAWGARREP